MKLRIVFIAVAAVLGATEVARATPRPLPFTYPQETLSEGELEVEFYTDVNPLRSQAHAADPTQGQVWSPAFKLQNEFEYGLTDRIELGFYQVFESSAQPGGGNVLEFDGLKWRVRTRLADPGEWPIDVGLYLELETMHEEIALEGKVILQRRFDRFRWMANLWVEEEFERPFDTKQQGRANHFIVNPTTGVVYEVTPSFQPGIEYFARGQLAPSGETPEERESSRVHHFVGPSAHVNLGRFWWSAGLYAHLGDMGTPKPGTAYGPFWFRSVIGLEL